MRVLVVEDSERLRELLSEALQSADYVVDGVGTARELFSSVAAANYDLLIVDLGLPDDEGLNAIRTLRSSGVSKPILIITARGSIDDRVTGLDSGADDYLIKPFDHAELLARVRALLRRPYEFQGTVLHLGNIELDQATFDVRCSGRPIELPLGQRRLLAILMRGRCRLIPKSEIQETLSDFDRDLSTNALEALVSRLRKLLSEIDSGVLIEAVRGVGYRLTKQEDK